MNISAFQEHAYVPYSKKPSVGIVQSEEGAYFGGSRIENMSFPLSINSSQNALFCCLSEGYTPKVLYADNSELTNLSFWEKEFGISARPLNTLNNVECISPILPKSIDPRETLIKLLDKALAAESSFPVAALVETEHGFFSGVNIECTSWNMGLCAERIAIAKTLTYSETPLQKLYIHSRDGEFSSPCGACRQVIIEHMPDRHIHLYHADFSESLHFSTDLLPHSFNK